MKSKHTVQSEPAPTPLLGQDEPAPRPWLTEDGNGNKTHYPADMADAFIASLEARLTQALVSLAAEEKTSKNLRNILDVQFEKQEKMEASLAAAQKEIQRMRGEQ
jgi:hypothetical protein